MRNWDFLSNEGAICLWGFFGKWFFEFWIKIQGIFRFSIFFLSELKLK